MKPIVTAVTTLESSTCCTVVIAFDDGTTIPMCVPISGTPETVAVALTEAANKARDYASNTKN